MTVLWWFGAIAAFGGLTNLFLQKNTLIAGIFWLTASLIGAAIMYVTY